MAAPAGDTKGVCGEPTLLVPVSAGLASVLVAWILLRDSMRTDVVDGNVLGDISEGSEAASGDTSALEKRRPGSHRCINALSAAMHWFGA